MTMSPQTQAANRMVAKHFFSIGHDMPASEWRARCKMAGCMWGYAVTKYNVLTSSAVIPNELEWECVKHVIKDHEVEYNEFMTPTPAQPARPAEVNLPITVMDGRTARPMYRGKPVPDFIALSSLDGWELNNSDYLKISLQHDCGFETITYNDTQFKYMVIEAMQHMTSGCVRENH